MSKGKKNAYFCPQCKGQIITIDLDEGTTPFSIACRATEYCNGMMVSGFYPDIPESIKPQYEWFKPKSLDGYDPATKEHIRLGGLILRPTKDEIKEDKIPALRKRQHKRKRKSFRSHKDWCQ